MRAMRQVSQRLRFQKEVDLMVVFCRAICGVVLSAISGMADACGSLSIRNSGDWRRFS